MEDHEIVANANETAAKVVHDAKNAAQAVMSTAEKTAHEIIENANTNPTNAELKDLFELHAESDREFQDRQNKVNDEASRSRTLIHERLDELPTKEDMAALATKNDVAELKQVLKAVRVGTGIFSYSFNNAAKIGSFVLFLIAIYGIIKFGIFGAVRWFFKLISGN
jgi:hypothetical protein